VEEAVELMERLSAAGVAPDLLAVNNGSKHGNYLEGEKIFIDLERTGQIHAAVKGRFGVDIAQHGITGTPLHLIGRFADYGIRKGNVGTQWQNIAHEGLPPALMQKMRDWAKGAGKDIKFATKPFKQEIDAIPSEFAEKIEGAAYREALQLFRAFRAEGTAKTVAGYLAVKA
jgi:fructose-bisphosphate aldolase class II